MVERGVFLNLQKLLGGLKVVIINFFCWFGEVDVLYFLFEPFELIFRLLCGGLVLWGCLGDLDDFHHL